MILTTSTSEDELDDLNFRSDVKGPATVVAVEDDDFLDEDSMTWSSESDCFRSDDPKDSICFTSEDAEDSGCSNPSGFEDS